MYDLGDGWTHEILAERIESPDKPLRHSVCVAGERHCPPEDCGGPGGYDALLAAIRDPDHPEHDNMVRWVGRGFDPEAFNLAGVNRKLKLHPVNATPVVRRLRLGDCLQEVNKGVGPTWQQYRLVGATRGGLASAKEGVGKTPERYKLVEPGTIFYNPMRILLGSIALLTRVKNLELLVLTTSCSGHDQGSSDPRWLYYWLRSEDGATFIRGLARGAVRERMLFQRLATSEIEAPSYESQLRFSRAIELLEQARVAAETRVATAKILAGAYLRAVFECDASRR